MGLKKSDQVPITPIVRPTLPFVMAHADIIGPLDPPSTLGHKYCLTVVDACTLCVQLPVKPLVIAL